MRIKIKMELDHLDVRNETVSPKDVANALRNVAEQVAALDKVLGYGSGEQIKVGDKVVGRWYVYKGFQVEDAER